MWVQEKVMHAALSILVAFLIALDTRSASAESGSDARSIVSHIFRMADTDGSGSLSPLEYREAGLERFGVSFAESDANSDGETSLDEYLALYERHHPPADRASS